MILETTGYDKRPPNDRGRPPLLLVQVEPQIQSMDFATSFCLDCRLLCIELMLYIISPLNSYYSLNSINFTFYFYISVYNLYYFLWSNFFFRSVLSGNNGASNSFLIFFFLISLGILLKGTLYALWYIFITQKLKKK